MGLDAMKSSLNETKNMSPDSMVLRELAEEQGPHPPPLLMEVGVAPVIQRNQLQLSQGLFQLYLNVANQ